MKNLNMIIFIIIALIFGGVIGWKISERKNSGPKAVMLGSPEYQKKFEVPPLSAKGSIDPSKKVEVFCEISGTVKKIMVSQGDKVKKGQDLIIINKPEFEQKMEQAESQLKEARLTLAKSQENYEKAVTQNKIQEINLKITLEDAEKQLSQAIADSKNRALLDQENINAVSRALKEAEYNYDNVAKDIAQVSQKEVEVKKKQIAKEEAETELKRSKELFDAKIISQKQLEDAQNKTNKARLDYEQSVKDLDNLTLKRVRDLELNEFRKKEWEYRVRSAKGQASVNKNINKEKVEAAEEKVKKYKTNLELFPVANKVSREDIEIAQEKLTNAYKNYEFARKDYMRTRLSSPVSGEVTFIDGGMRVGREVTPGTRCVIVSNTDKLYIKTEFNQENISYISQGQDVSILGVNNSLEKALPGKVISISPIINQPEIDNSNRNILYNVFIDFDRETDFSQFNPGISVNLQFSGLIRENVLTVPLSSVIRQNNRSYVFLYDNGRVRKIEVKTGVSNMLYTEVIEGLSDKDKIAVKWEGNLEDNDVVK